ncbi:MAG TPA: helix-turn-helix transcriptional regulator [Pseudonocardiaceae bacterium]
MDDAKALGTRLREVRSWRQLTLREAAGLAGLSFSFWGQVERGEKAVANRKTLEAMATALRVHPTELSGQPWTPQDAVGADAHAGLMAIETALERYELGTDPEVTVRAWPEIQADLDRLVKITHWTSDHAAMGELAPALIGELLGAYLLLPQRRQEVLLGLMSAYTSAMWTTKRLGGRGLPTLAARAVQQCAEELSDPVWLGYAAWLRGNATGQLDRAAQYRRSVAAAENLTSELDSGDALQAYGMLHLSAALAAGAQADHATAATHLEEAAALAARMDTEVGTWAHLWFGPTNVGIWRTSLAVELGEHGQALEAAKTVHPELLPGAVRQAEYWAEVGRALVAGKKTREKGVRVLLHAEQLAPQLIRNDLFVRETVSDLLRQARRDAGGRELRGLAWRMGVAPIG